MNRAVTSAGVSGPNSFIGVISGILGSFELHSIPIIGIDILIDLVDVRELHCPVYSALFIYIVVVALPTSVFDFSSSTDPFTYH